MISVTGEELSRLEMMSSHEDNKWDLSPKDKLAINHALHEIVVLRRLLASLAKAVDGAADVQEHGVKRICELFGTHTGDRADKKELLDSVKELESALNEAKAAL